MTEDNYNSANTIPVAMKIEHMQIWSRLDHGRKSIGGQG